MKNARGILLLFFLLQYGGRAQSPAQITPTRSDLEEISYNNLRTPSQYISWGWYAWNPPIFPPGMGTWGAGIGYNYKVSDGSFTDNRTAYRFDLSSLPQNIEITGAKLLINAGLFADNCSGEPFDMTFYAYAYPWEYILEDTVLISGIPTFISAQNKWGKVTEGFIYDSLLLSLNNRDAAQDEITNAQLTADIMTALSKPNVGDRKIGIAFRLDAEPQNCFYDIGISTSGPPEFQYSEDDLILEIEYNLVNVTYLNDFGRPDPTGTTVNADFRITPPGASWEWKNHNARAFWSELANGTLEMFDHDTLLYDSAYEGVGSDSRHYNREPKQWERTGGGVNPAYGPPDYDTWTTAQIPDANEFYTFTAKFYRLVDNKFKAYALGSALGGSDVQITDNIIGPDLDQSGQPDWTDYDPEVNQRRADYLDHRFDVILTTFYDANNARIFLGWDPQPNGTSTMADQTVIDYTNNRVTTTIRPDLHHKDMYSNTYTAYYGQFKAMALEHASGNLDLTTALTANSSGFQFTGYDAANKAVAVKVPAAFDYGNVTYVFAGWWDGVYGREFDDNGVLKIERHVAVNNYAPSASRYDLVAMYKAHMNSRDNAAVTKTNSQRKIAVDDQGRHHVVYESAGLIWYSRSDDNGQTWLPERKVNAGLVQGLTANGTYDGYCRRPAIAVTGDGSDGNIVITYVDENPANPGVYVVRPDWLTHDLVYTSELKTEPDVLQQPAGLPAGTCIPAIAINPWGTSKVWMAVWNDGSELRFSVQSHPGDIANRDFLADNDLFLNGIGGNPEFPSIVWGSPELKVDEDYEFQVTWLQGTNVRFARVGIDEVAGSIQIDANTWTAVSGVATTETVHSSSSIYQLGQPLAIHAPSVTADNAILYEDGSRTRWDHPLWTFAAYEIEDPAPLGGSGGSGNTGTAWPASSFVVSPQRRASKTLNGVYSPAIQVGSKPGRFRVHLRIAPSRYNIVVPWTYNLLYEYRTTYNGTVPLNPCVGVLENPSGFSHPYHKIEQVRTLFQEQSFHISVAKEVSSSLQTPYRTYFHEEGIDPNQPPVSSIQNIRSIYCDNSSSVNLKWSINSEYTALRKTSIINEPIEMRQLTYTTDSSLAILGICNPRLVDASGAVVPIQWDPMKDSSGLEWNYPIAMRMRTDTFDVTGYASLYYERELLTVNRQDFDDQEFRIQFHDAETHEVLLTEAVRCMNMPEDSTYYELTAIDISSLGNRDVYITVDASADMDTADVEVLRISANLEIDEELEKFVRSLTSVEIPTSVTLSNFPNPFNPSTEITYGIPAETHVKLAVYDNLGREVKVLANGWKAAGTYTVTFNAAELPSGMYLYRIETGKGSVSKKMVLMK